MKFALPSFARWRLGAVTALARFPWNILCGVAGAAAMIVSIHSPKNESVIGQCGRLAMTAAVGMPLFFSLRMLRERSDKLRRWPIEIAGLLLLIGWFFTLPDHPGDGPGIIWIRWLLLLAALHFFAAVSLYVRGEEGNGFWQFNRTLFLRFCLTTLHTGVLTIGLELALLSADKLFQLKVEKAYGDLFFLMIGVFQPTFFLAGVPHDFTALDAETDYPRGLKAFTQFALAPLVAVYTAILYAYAIKIVITRSWPHGWVALPVLLLSGIGILAFLLLYPLRSRQEEKWAVWFTNNFPRALAALAILLLLSVYVRVGQYGVTEERYLGLVAGGWIFLWAIVFTFRRSSGIRWIPASLAIIALLAGFGPWSAGATSKASQLTRLEGILQSHGMWQDNHAWPSAQLVDFSKADETNLRTTLTYLIQTHGGTAVQRIFQPVSAKLDWQKLTSWQGARDIIEALKISSHDEVADQTKVHRKEDAFVSVGNFTRITNARLSGGCPVQRDDITLTLEKGNLKIQTFQGGAPQIVPLGDLSEVLQTATLQGARNPELPDEQLTLNFQQGSRSFRIVFDSISFKRDGAGVQIVGCELFLLEK